MRKDAQAIRQGREVYPRFGEAFSFKIGDTVWCETIKDEVVVIDVYDFNSAWGTFHFIVKLSDGSFQEFNSYFFDVVF